MKSAHDSVATHLRLRFRWRPRATSFKLLEHRSTALAYRGICWVFAYVGRIIPAAFALFAVGFADFDPKATGSIAGRRALQRNCGNNEQIAQVVLVPFEYGIQRIGSSELDLCFQALANLLLISRFFQNFQHLVADVP